MTTTPDPVAQARAWLSSQTGQRSKPPLEPVVSHGFNLDGSVEPELNRHLDPDSRPNANPDADLSLGAAPDAAPDADAENVARTIALRKLAAQARTRHELGQALQKKNVPAEVAARVLDRLEDVGLVNDQAFTEDWVQSRQQRRHLSRSALRRELQAKGIDRELIDATLATVNADDELTAARKLAAKKAATMDGFDPLVRQRRLAGMLARRGFSSGVVATVFAGLRVEQAAEPDA